MSDSTGTSSSFVKTVTGSSSEPTTTGGDDLPDSIPELGGGSRVARVIQTRSRTHQGVNIGEAMSEINSTLEDIRRRRVERKRNARQTVELRQARRAQEVAIVAGENEAARNAAVVHARPNLIFTGRQIPLPVPQLVDEDEERRVHEVSSESSFDRALDEMEGELHSNSVSNPDDAPKPDLSEKSVAQEPNFGYEAEVAEEDTEVPEPMEVEKGESFDDQEDVAAGGDRPSNEANSDA